MSYQFGVDIGGTFTDLFIFDDESEAIFQEKIPTTPNDFSKGFMNAISKAIEKHNLTISDLEYLSHGTTVATNAMLEREGVNTGLITTDGFRDITAIAREDRQNIYELSPEKTPTFTDRQHRIGVPERISANGQVTEPLETQAVLEAIDHFESNNIDSVAVSLLHAYQNDKHEQEIKEMIETNSDLSVSISSRVMPEIREYERTLSTVINSYISPIVRDYIEHLETSLTEIGIDNTLHLMQANGGVITPQHLDGRSLRLINSGPAAGVIGAKNFVEKAGEESIITLDMGGTSADACVVRDGTIETTTEGELNRIPLLFPQVDVRAVGAGGGSIAWLDPTDVLKVGPKSVGADPGPACYGCGGTEPTVTDAALVLGYLNPDYFLGGDMNLDEQAAHDSLEKLEDTLGQDTYELADGILSIASTNMTQAIRVITVEKGYDPRNFALVSYGGAGPLFATRLAESLDIETAIIPPSPGVLSASGLLAANKQYNFSKTNILSLHTENVAAINDVFTTLQEQSQDVINSASTILRSVDLRYEGQTSKLNVSLPDGEITPDLIETTCDRFCEKYEDIFGHSNPEEEIIGVTWRFKVTEKTAKLGTPKKSERGSIDDAIKNRREVYSDGEFKKFDIYDRYNLPTGSEVDGPALVEEPESTTVIDDSYRVTIDEMGNMRIDLTS